MNIPIALQLHSVPRGGSAGPGGGPQPAARIGFLRSRDQAAFTGWRLQEEFRRRADELGLQLVGDYGPFPPQDWEAFLDDQQALANEIVVSGLLPNHFSWSGRGRSRREEFNERRSSGAGAGNDGALPPALVGVRSLGGRLRCLRRLSRPPRSRDRGLGRHLLDRGGRSAPGRDVSRYGSRVKRLHVKDGPGTKPTWPDGPPPYSDPQTAIGSGTLDIATIWPPPHRWTGTSWS